MTFCVVGEICSIKNYKIDEDSLYWAKRIISEMGENPHYHKVSGDLVLSYAYGQCQLPLAPKQYDLDILVMSLGGDCNTCVSRPGDSE